MRMKDKLRLAAEAAMLAAVLYGLLAAPGLVSDRDSLVPAGRAVAQAGAR